MYPTPNRVFRYSADPEQRNVPSDMMAMRSAKVSAAGENINEKNENRVKQLLKYGVKLPREKGYNCGGTTAAKCGPKHSFYLSCK